MQPCLASSNSQLTRGGVETSENLRLINAVIYYSKIRFAVNLLPLLKTAPGLRRVVSVFAAGLEGKVVPDDLDGNKSSLIAHRDNVASMLTLAMVKLSEDAPQVSWVHDFPGFVESGLWESAPGLLGVVMRTVVWALGRFFYMDPEECGQRQLFMATSARFPPSRSAAAAEAAGEDATASGVGLVDDLTVATALDGKPGGGNYSANEHGDTIPDKKVAMLRRYMTDGTKDVVWKHTMDTFRRVTGKEKL